MNLLFLDSIAVDVYGGLEHWIGMVSLGLVARGHRVTVSGRPGSEFLRRVGRLSSEIEAVPLEISGDFHPSTITAVKRVLEEREIEIVICNFNKDVRLGGLAARWKGNTRVVWRLGNNLTSTKAIHRYLTPKLLDGAITPSHELKRQVLECGYIKDEQVRVIHTGVPAPKRWHEGSEAKEELRARYQLPPDSRIAVTSGRFVSQKGHTYLVEAAEGLIGRHPELRFLWLGDGPLEGDLQRQIDAAGMTDRFVFAGLLDDFELELAGADLMVHPSTIEPFGIVLLEGMRVGLPIVSTLVGGIPEVVADGRTGLLVPPGDAEALKSAMTTLLDDPRLMSYMGAAGKERWRVEFDYEVMINRLEVYLESLLEPASEGRC